MLDLREYTCLGAALRDEIDRFAATDCLIERSATVRRHS